MAKPKQNLPEIGLPWDKPFSELTTTQLVYFAKKVLTLFSVVIERSGSKDVLAVYHQDFPEANERHCLKGTHPLSSVWGLAQNILDARGPHNPLLKIRESDCPRCGLTHVLRFLPLTNPSHPVTHWSVCLTTGQPVMASFPESPPNKKPRLRE